MGALTGLSIPSDTFLMEDIWNKQMVAENIAFSLAIMLLQL